MAYYPDQHHRRTVRLRDYDYRAAGAYFVTICTEARRCVLGSIVGDEVRPTAAGEIVAQCWAALPHRFPGLQLDTSVVMPNHFHATILLVGARFIAPTPSGIEGLETPDSTRPRARDVSPRSEPRPTNRGSVSASIQSAAEEGAMNRAPTGLVGLGEVVRAFKAAAARQIRAGADPTFAWQRNYFERVLRDDESLASARKYIAENPAKWARDPERPR